MIYLLYQDYLSIIQLVELIDKFKNIYETERKQFEKKQKEYPNYHLVFYK